MSKKEHFWIPEEEVLRIDKKITARSKSRNISFAEHGTKLSNSLQSIKKSLDSVASVNSLADSDLLIFSVELPEGEKIKDKKELFISNGMDIKAVKNTRNAIVASTNSQFQSLKRRVDAYTQDGTYKTHFDYIADIKPYIGTEKNSNHLNKVLCLGSVPERIDLQLMLVPNLGTNVYTPAIRRLREKIVSGGGSVQDEVYYLSDNTPVIRAIISPSSLANYENDPAVYRIEETDFFSVDANQDDTTILYSFELSQDVDISSLPTVAILDSGVIFPQQWSQLIVERWVAPGSAGGDADHGTKVASNIVFRYLSQQKSEQYLRPRAKIIDCNILDGSVPSNIFIRRIQEAVDSFLSITKVYNLSANAMTPIEGDEMSIVGYEIDALQLRKGVQFVVSAGNHNLWQSQSSLEDIIDDDDSRISAPADSMLSIVVGSIVGANHPGSLSAKNEIAPYSRRGPGFTGFSKPDIAAYAGTIIANSGNISVPVDDFSLMMSRNGTLVSDAGTSFSAPIISGDYAEILNIVPYHNTLLAKALLYHNAIPIWDAENITDDELSFAHNIYGRGVSDLDSCKFSFPHKVTFIRFGALNRVTKERVTIYMPETLAAQQGRNVARVSVTCLSMPSVDRTKGTEYLGAYVRASLKKSSPDGVTLKYVSPGFKEGRQKWDVCQHFSNLFSKFNAGDWQIWLELFSRWDNQDSDVPYALVVTIEDVTKTLNIYSEIESLNRYRSMNNIRLMISN